MNTRPSSWIIGLGVGLALAGGIIASDTAAGLVRPLWLAFYVSLVVGATGAVVTLSGLGHGAAALLFTLAELRERWTPPPLEPEPLDETEPDEPDDGGALEREATRQHDWRVALLQAIMYAESYDSWTFDTLGPTGVNVMERTAWDAVTDYLRDCQRLNKRNRSRTVYADGYTAADVRDEVRRGALPLPFPLGDAPRVYSPRCTETVLHSQMLLAQARKAGKVAPLPVEATFKDKVTDVRP